VPGLPEVRISDQDRDRGAQEIREHFAAGRLTEEELDERVQAVYPTLQRAEPETSPARSGPGARG
jgi:hypothetical protein